MRKQAIAPFIDNNLQEIQIASCDRDRASDCPASPNRYNGEKQSGSG